MTSQQRINRLMHYAAEVWGVEKRLIEERKGTSCMKIRNQIAVIGLSEGYPMRKIQQKFSIELPKRVEIVSCHDQSMKRDTFYAEAFQRLIVYNREMERAFFANERVYEYIPASAGESLQTAH